LEEQVKVKVEVEVEIEVKVKHLSPFLIWLMVE